MRPLALVCRYIHFFKQTAAIFYFCHFPYNIRFLINIALIVLVVYYFDAEPSEKIVTGKMHKITYFFRKQMAAILYFVIFHIIGPIRFLLI